MSRDELIALVRRQDAQISAMAAQIADLVQENEQLAARLARLEHLLSRNSGNSSSPPSKDDEPGKPAPPEKRRRGGGPKRRRGKQPGAPGANLAWTDTPDARVDRFPDGACSCGHDLAGARPEGARTGPVGYGPNLQAFAVYLMVVHFLPAHRCVQLLESLTGAAPSVGFVHGMLARAAGLLVEVDKRIRTLITLAYAVSCDETPLRVGPREPKPGRKKAEKYLLVACTEAYTHYLLGDRDLDTFKAFVLQDLCASGSVVVHDRYQNYDSAELGELIHQLCCAHLLRDIDDAAQVYPDALWPTQIADALRALIHQANLTREQGRDAIADDIRNELITRFRHGVLVGLSDTTSHGDRPGERKARLLLEVLRDREVDVLRFAHDLKVPPTSNQAERDLRPSKVQQNISGRLTSEQRTRDRYTIRGYLSTAAKHGRNMMDALRGALLGQPWTPPDPSPA